MRDLRKKGIVLSCRPPQGIAAAGLLYFSGPGAKHQAKTSSAFMELRQTID
jgi:hypothetical protein